MLVNMKLSILWVVCGLFIATVRAAESPASIAFFYGQVDSVRELLSYERVVVSPNQISPAQRAQLKAGQVKVFAYLSVGEWDNSRGDLPVDADVLMRNTDWDSLVVDLRDDAWRSYVVEQATALWAEGYDGIFLDTLDSYLLPAPLAQAQAEQQDALTTLLNSIAANSPESDVALILNRGFEVLDSLAFQPEAVLAESMIHGYDAGENQYFRRSTEDTQWLEDRLDEVQALGIEAIVLDYLPSSDQGARLAAAREISQRGYTPYISNGLLTDFGVSSRYPQPRRVLVFYEGEEFVKSTSPCLRFIAVLVEYEGYVPECVDINQLSSLHFDTAKYAGVVYWLPEFSYEDNAVISFVETVLNTAGVRSLFIGNLPQPSNRLLGSLQLQTTDSYQGALTTDAVDLLYPLPSSAIGRFPRYVIRPGSDTDKIDVKVSIRDASGAEGVGVVETAWGGVVTQPVTVQSLMGNVDRWSLDPFEYVLSLLKLPEIPAADVTTESGRRIFTSHIDGDGFPSQTWTDTPMFAAQSIQQEVLEYYDLPQTVSIIEGEIAPYGLYPDDSEQLESIARQIFALNNVEVASHTFSHPFFWDERVAADERAYGDSLAIPGYTLDMDREIFGSVAYIERELLPADSDKKVEVFLWSGSADPTRDVLEKTESLGILNVNGGNTYVVDGNFSLAQVFPQINWYPSAVQVYAPLLNENLFTNLWTENFGGYARAIESFELLGHPRRLKTISMYYHMYSGVYPSSINALHKVYDWALTQEITPLYLSDYAARAKTLYETGLARSLSSDPDQREWFITSTGIKTLRISPDKVPGVASQGIAGMNTGPDGIYLSLSEPRVKLIVEDRSESTVLGGRAYLVSANGMIRQWDGAGDQLDIVVESYVPLQMTLGQASHCDLGQPDARVQAQVQGDTLVLRTAAKGRFDIRLSCGSTGQ